MARRSRKDQELPRLGKRPPRYRFFLNPYVDLRCTNCPQCGAKMRQRKLPLVIHIEPQQLLALNKTCRYCPTCDLLIAHQDEVEASLAAYFAGRMPDLVGNDYLVVGTEDRADWLRGMREPLAVPDALEVLHDFAEVVTFKPAPTWVPR